ncbi:glutamyl-tRNA amidotransferase [Campylobacter mucosalis]|uniref:GatB/YqeY domain-containing protein n=1 Tax=Campylobacter mucosalis TaxID=202 RepID=UPI0004D3613D|nr:GatB/YqeY domain-containing protein [Campylobacter mucosalis]KEA46361.1 glutamyl-tRNA amidotransferase [Campylobacter mucosalis]QKF63160.1 GatB/YqeY family protein [Campylobacter mucosalis]
MSIKEQILADIKTAMKEQNNFERDALRTLHSALKQVEVDKRIELSDEVVLPILQKEIKKRTDSAQLYVQGGREELAKKENDEIALISRYLPAQLSDDELKDKVKNIILTLGASSIKELGSVVKIAKEQIGASADAKRISEVAKALLS